MADPREVEIKLELPEDEARALARRGLKGFGAAAASRQKLSSTYFDTPKNTLKKRGLSLRVRQTKDGNIQTVKKSNGHSFGLFDRSEWESGVAGGEPEPAALAKTPVAKALSKRQKLQPVFETVVERTSWVVPAGQSTVEIALDRGRVTAGQDSRHFAELELELKTGNPDDLFALVRRLGDRQSLKLGVVTKSERGYALVAKAEQAPVKAEAVKLHPDMTAADAFRLVAHSCLRQFRLNETLLVETRAVDALHEARVGMRRLRSAISLFKDLVSDDTLAGLKEGLRSASRTLGRARDIDVYLERAVVPEGEADPAEPGVAAFVEKVRTLREAAYDEVIATLDSPDFRRLMIDLLVWIEAGAWTTTDDPDRVAMREMPIPQVAAKILGRQFKKVKRKGRDLSRLDPAERHRVRIEAKKLRYAAEFFAGLVDGKEERRNLDAFVRSMKAFQELLGKLNDLHTGHELAADLARRATEINPTQAPLLFAAGHLSGEQDERVGPLLKAADKALAKFMTQEKFWAAWG